MPVTREFAVKRVRCYVDGYNLYHAIAEMKVSHYKWLDLWELALKFIDPAVHTLDKVYYFSAFATWLPGPYARHREYVRAIQIAGVEPVMGKFYEKDRECKTCGRKWIAHEEKNSDVNLAVYMLDDAYQNNFDMALLISRDSDLSMALWKIAERFPSKDVVILAPPGQRHSKDLAKCVPQKRLRQIKPIHLQRSLLPEHLANEHLTATRPSEYAPPATT